ncbi:hypothetical protein L7F22_015667 [Adiantum nelumboides]|nr:hypothetical protein [Adiantum nelumboides]
MEEVKLHKARLVPNEEAMAKLETLIQLRKEAVKDMGLDIEVHNLDNLGEEAAQLQAQHDTLLWEVEVATGHLQFVETIINLFKSRIPILPIRPPVHLGLDNSCVQLGVQLGDCVACGISIMHTIVTDVYMLRCQHTYHPLCFVTACKSVGQCLFHGCKEPLKDALKPLALGEANMDEHVGTKKDLMEGIFGSFIDGIDSQAGSSCKPNIDSMCGGCGDKNASQKQAVSPAKWTVVAIEVQEINEMEINSLEELSWIGDVHQEPDEKVEDIAAKQDADVTPNKVEEDQKPTSCPEIEEILPKCPGWGYLVLNFCKVKKLIILDLNGLFMKQDVSKHDPKTGKLEHPPRPASDRVKLKRVNEKLWIYYRRDVEQFVWDLRQIVDAMIWSTCTAANIELILCTCWPDIWEHMTYYLRDLFSNWQCEKWSYFEEIAKAPRDLQAPLPCLEKVSRI